MVTFLKTFLLGWLVGSSSISIVAPWARAETRSTPEPRTEEKIEPRAIALLKAMSDRLSRARSMSFTAITTYESASRIGPPLVYTTLAEVTLQRPDKLRVISPGDGQANEFYYDGKTITAYSPTENLVATAPAPATIDAALKLAYDSAAIYFPFTDMVVNDPYRDIAPGLTYAFFIGQSRAVGGTTTDMIAIANDRVFAQIWIGAEDKLPRMIRAVYRDDPARLRHQVAFDNWKLDIPLPANTFTFANPNRAKPIPFARPEPTAIPPATNKPSTR
jgi:hypothetical protein